MTLSTICCPEITVAGYPRSGNVWLCRLLGDALDVPVIGGSLAAEGQERSSPGYVRQAHLWVGKGHHLNTEVTDGFITIVRDPRDVAVSAAAFWGWTIDEALDKMIEGPGPLELPPWKVFVESWQSVPMVRYEDLWTNPKSVLSSLVQSDKSLDEVIERQSFAVKREEMRYRGNKYPFGRKAQKNHLRQGGMGEWREVLSTEQKNRALVAWERMLYEYA